MEYMVGNGSGSQAPNYILCCECGTQIEPNLSNMCVACVRSQVDITEGIPKQGTLYFCRNCERYLQPPQIWVSAQLESRELLSLCLKKLKGLNKVNLVDAGFVWTEPHSKRIKVKLTIQKEVMNGAVLQQTFVVEFTVNKQMCDDCHRVEAKDFWRAVVQVRQKTDHKKTFFYLEQLILKHSAHTNTVNIRAVHGGLDFFFQANQEARKFLDFLQAVVPCRYIKAKELVSHDCHSNHYNYKETFSVEIVPICKDEVICLPKKLSINLGHIGPICVVLRVSKNIHLIDAKTLQIAEMSVTVFWREPFVTICIPKDLTEYMVMDVEEIPEHEKPHKIPASRKHILADVYVARMSDLGQNDQQFHCRTHLGHLLSAGDTVLGFDMLNSNVNNFDLDKLNTEKIPDVVIVKKVYNRQRRNQKRKWKLRHLDTELVALETASVERDYTEFLEDLEEDAAYRQNVNIYKDPTRIAVESSDTEDEAVPQISLAEMLEDLHIEDNITGAEGDDMME